MSRTISEITELLVAGYTRQCEQNVTGSDIPNAVKGICKDFYGYLMNLGSDILSDLDDELAFIDILSQKFDVKSFKEIKLIYNSDKHGLSYDSFKKYCHGKPYNITLFQLDDDHIFGGYTAVSWSAHEGYKTDPSAFLFFLKCNDTSKEATIYNVKIPKYAIYHYYNTFGCWFGKRDIVIFHSNYNNASDSMTCKFQDTKSYDCASEDLCGHSSSSKSYYSKKVKCEMFQILY